MFIGGEKRVILVLMVDFALSLESYIDMPSERRIKEQRTPNYK